MSINLNFQEPIGDTVASARVSAAGAFEGVTDGFITVGLAANVFTLTLHASQAIDATNASYMAGSADGTSNVFEVTPTSDTAIQVRGFTQAGAAVDAPFYVRVTRKAVG